jgi:hypothetical protein
VIKRQTSIEVRAEDTMNLQALGFDVLIILVYWKDQILIFKILIIK